MEFILSLTFFVLNRIEHNLKSLQMSFYWLYSSDRLIDWVNFKKTVSTSFVSLFLMNYTTDSYRHSVVRERFSNYYYYLLCVFVFQSKICLIEWRSTLTSTNPMAFLFSFGLFVSSFLFSVLIYISFVRWLDFWRHRLSNLKIKQLFIFLLYHNYKAHQMQYLFIYGWE